MRSRSTVLTAVVTVAVTALLLTGCSGAQTKAQACKILESDLTSASSDLSAAFSKIQSDPATAEKGLATFEGRLEKSAAKVTNPGVKTATDATITAVTKMDKDLKAYVEDPSDTASLQSSASAVQTSFTKLGTVCTSA